MPGDPDSSFPRAAHAGFGYDAAVRLDEASFDAASSRIGFGFRTGQFREALSRLPAAFGTLFASAESRLSVFSSLMIAVSRNPFSIVAERISHCIH